MQTLEDAAARLRAAVASQTYAEARGLIPAYCALLEGEFRRWPASSPEARRIAEEAMAIAGKICIYTNENVTYEELE